MTPIGTIHSPYFEISNMPVQPRGAQTVEGRVVVEAEFEAGLKDLEGFSHLYLIYQFHLAQKTQLSVVPFLDPEPRGVFATRSPLRPNHIGLSVVELLEVKGCELLIRGVDVLDGTPLLDLKPYIAAFDQVGQSRSGWMKASADEVAAMRSDERFG
ncbi:MAG: tRNA (N6-threonylcarbamoyladenosine(37)-N6)-methyltransferase TrmO [bacterium]|nr:tRNA (N6-threonylcarbamoyladenosine(37)-N6)-methyltransferase TrmO [bacterium]